MVFGWVILFLIDPKHDGDIFIFRRSRDNYLLSAAIEMDNCLLFLGKFAGTVDNYVDSQRPPGEISRVFLLK